jgi:DnaJ-class molecular chaperone
MSKGSEKCFKCGGSGMDYTMMAMPTGFATKCKVCEGTRKCTKEDNERYMERIQESIDEDIMPGLIAAIFLISFVVIMIIFVLN